MFSLVNYFISCEALKLYNFSIFGTKFGIPVETLGKTLRFWENLVPCYQFTRKYTPWSKTISTGNGRKTLMPITHKNQDIINQHETQQTCEHNLKTESIRRFNTNACNELDYKQSPKKVRNRGTRFLTHERKLSSKIVYFTQ